MEGVFWLMCLLLIATVSVTQVQVDLSHDTFTQIPDHTNRSIFPVSEHNFWLSSIGAKFDDRATSGFSWRKSPFGASNFKTADSFFFWMWCIIFISVTNKVFSCASSKHQNSQLASLQFVLFQWNPEFLCFRQMLQKYTCGLANWHTFRHMPLQVFLCWMNSSLETHLSLW